tara:strand:- start:56 stop:601 length:546 start_codon:yes stop_codon:yes gene_type:complete
VRSVTILEHVGQYQAWSSGDAMCCVHAHPPAHFMFASLRYPPHSAEHTHVVQPLCLHRIDDPGFEHTSHGVAAALVGRLPAIGFMAFLLRTEGATGGAAEEGTADGVGAGDDTLASASSFANGMNTPSTVRNAELGATLSFGGSSFASASSSAASASSSSAAASLSDSALASEGRAHGLPP